MGTQENKAVVSRFMNEVTTGRNIDPDLIDELLAPNYVNLAMPDAGLAAFKAMLPALAYYRLADGKIVVNDVMFSPDLLQMIAVQMAPPPGAQS